MPDALTARARWAAPRHRLLRAVHGRARRDDLHVALAVDPGRPRLRKRGQPAVGRQRLHAASSAASCCSAVEPPTCSGGGGGLFVAGVVVFTLSSLACALAETSEVTLIVARAVPGPRCCARLAGRAVDHHDDVRRGRRAHPRAGDLGRHRGGRQRRRPAARRRPDRGTGCRGSGCSSFNIPVGLAVIAIARCATCPSRATTGRRAQLRPHRRGHRHRRPAAARLRDRQGRVGRVGCRCRRWACRGRRSPCWPASCSWSGAPAAPLVRLGTSENPHAGRGQRVLCVVVAGLFGMFFFARSTSSCVLGYSPLEAGLAFLPVSVRDPYRPGLSRVDPEHRVEAEGARRHGARRRRAARARARRAGRRHLPGRDVLRGWRPCRSGWATRSCPDAGRHDGISPRTPAWPLVCSTPLSRWAARWGWRCCRPWPTRAPSVPDRPGARAVAGRPECRARRRLPARVHRECGPDRRRRADHRRPAAPARPRPYRCDEPVMVGRRVTP